MVTVQSLSCSVSPPATSLRRLRAACSRTCAGCLSLPACRRPRFPPAPDTETPPGGGGRTDRSPSRMQQLRCKQEAKRLNPAAFYWHPCQGSASGEGAGLHRNDQKSHNSFAIRRFSGRTVPFARAGTPSRRAGRVGGFPAAARTILHHAVAAHKIGRRDRERV